MDSRIKSGFRHRTTNNEGGAYISLCKSICFTLVKSNYPQLFLFSRKYKQDDRLNIYLSSNSVVAIEIIKRIYAFFTTICAMCVRVYECVRA